MKRPVYITTGSNTGADIESLSLGALDTDSPSGIPILDEYGPFNISEFNYPGKLLELPYETEIVYCIAASGDCTGADFSLPISNLLAKEDNIDNAPNTVGSAWVTPDSQIVAESAFGSKGTIREGDTLKYGDVAQFSNTIFNSQSLQDGTVRITSELGFWNLPTASKAAILEYDVKFENIWDFNSIGQDADELVAYATKSGLDPLSGWLDGYDRTPESVGLFYENEYGFDITNSAEVNPTYKDTGFPFQTGKIHGLAPQNPAVGGDNSIDPDAWSCRVHWIKNVKTHPSQSGGGIYVDGIDPDIGPTWGAYIYDQDRHTRKNNVHRKSDGEGRLHSFCEDFISGSKGIKTEQWYRIKMFVQLNQGNTNTGICDLRVYHRDDLQNELLLTGSSYMDSIRFHATAQTIPSTLINNFRLDHFFGGGNPRYCPRIDPAWSSQVEENTAVYSRFQNFNIYSVPFLSSSTYLSSSNNGVTSSILMTHPDIDVRKFEDIEYRNPGEDPVSGPWTYETSSIEWKSSTSIEYIEGSPGKYSASIQLNEIISGSSYVRGKIGDRYTPRNKDPYQS